jgi:hypothetical protein
MPELSPKTKQYQKQRLRSLIVQQPMISTLEMQQHLAKDGLTSSAFLIVHHLVKGGLANIHKGLLLRCSAVIFVMAALP